ncbi:ATP-binding protein [Streptomyces sp. NPDC094038]|uniref:ATP-binding protein n=1 Tax=Streptomyces sp. NPDC094038 TaxID=3366055 RepID=UPI00381DD14E
MNGFYGRDNSLDQLRSHEIPIAVVTGDEGIGKTTLLAVCREAVRSENLVSEQITRLPHRTGGLQASILSQLASIVSSLASEKGVVAKLGEQFAARARIAIGTRRKEFALAVAKELLTVLKERLGSDTGQALGEFFADISVDNSESLLEALNNKIDGDALQAVIDIAGDVASLRQGSVLFLFFENAQNLSDDDLRQLADTSSMLPDNVVMRVEHQDSNEEHRRRIKLLRSGGVAQIPLTGLGEDIVKSWCLAEGVPASLHNRVYVSTRGYPLFVGDTIAQALTKRRIGNIAPQENFRLNTLDSLNDLDPDTAAAARQLSAFIDPPPHPQLIGEVLGEGMTGVRWDGIQARLQQSRIFTTQVGGVPWFHEARRRCIWESLSPQTKQDVADRAVDILLTLFRDTGNSELLVNLAFIGAESSKVQEDPRAGHLCRATLDEIALLSALLELAEPANEGPSPETPTAWGDSVFDYSRQAFMQEVDTTAALGNLSAAEIIFEAQNENVAVLIPRLSELAYFILLGRAGAELPRFPMMQIATVIFQHAASPRMTGFITCNYGIGKQSLSKAIGDGRKAYAAERTRSQKLIKPYTDAVFMQASVEQQPYYAFATFPDADQATRSAESLKLASGDYWGLHLDVDWILQLPAGKIRSRRFLNALERLRFRQREGLSFQQNVTRKADFLRHVRASLNRLERAALELEEPVSYVVIERDDHVMLVEISGRGDGVTSLNSSTHSEFIFSGPYRWAALKSMLNLQPGERTKRVTTQAMGATFDGPKKILERLGTRAKTYNRHQPAVQFRTTQEDLSDALATSVVDTFFDAQSLAAVLSQYGWVDLTPQRTLFMIYRTGEEGRRLEGSSSEAVYLTVPEPALDHDTIEVKVADCADATAFDTELFGVAFSEQLARIPEIADGSRDWRMFLSVGDAHYVISQLLGYEVGDVRFVP